VPQRGLWLGGAVSENLYSVCPLCIVCMMGSLPPGFARPPTAQQAVLGELRRAILSGRLAPGTQVVQETIAEQLGVSRVPVREALKILEGTGQVVYVPHRGYFVAELNTADLEEIYRLRDLLEAEAARSAVVLLDRVELERMGEAAEECAAAARAGDVPRATAANRYFHFTLLEASRMRRLVDLVRSLWDASEVYRTLYFSDERNRALVEDEHEAILAALGARDSHETVRLLALHRANALAGLRTLLTHQAAQPGQDDLRS
jgi:DNA-binding GntR family transcriptional regulator